jgi:hypothetical protein
MLIIWTKTTHPQATSPYQTAQSTAQHDEQGTKKLRTAHFISRASSSLSGSGSSIFVSYALHCICFELYQQNVLREGGFS